MEAAAFSPGHITGFFTIKDDPPSVLQKGSLGAGVSLALGVRTVVKAVPAASKKVKILFNGKPVNSAVVSERVLDIFFQKAGLSQNFNVSIDHSISIPMGSGFGSSGAGALSLVCALNKAFDAGFSSITSAQIAHQAEVEMKTGLGTVIGETYGGIEVRVKSGAPGIGKILQIPINGPLSTKEFLSNDRIREKINKYGESLVENILNNPGISEFLLCARKFAEKTGLITPEAARIFSFFDENGVMAGMPIFGNGVFTIVEEKRAAFLCRLLKSRLLKKSGERAELIISDIDFMGARVLY